MSVIGDVLNQLGKDVMPQVGAIVFPDVMDIKTSTATRSAGGGVIQATATNAYTDVPCVYAPNKNETRQTVAGSMLSKQEYLVTFPTHDEFGERIDFDIEHHWFVTQTRGNEPTKRFRPIGLQDVSGVVFKVVCYREDVE